MDAAARPLPSDDTTPPVMKMYLVVRPSVLVIGIVIRAPAPSASRRPRGRGDQAPNLFEILRCIDAERVVLRLDGLDADPVLEPAELLERSGAFERRRIERRQHEQGAAAIRVQPDVLVERRPAAAGIPDVRNRRPRKIQRVP